MDVHRDAGHGTLAATNITGLTYGPNFPVTQPDGTYLAMGDARAYDAVYYLGDLDALSHRRAAPEASLLYWGDERHRNHGDALLIGHRGGPGSSAFPSTEKDINGFRYHNYTVVDSASGLFPSSRVVVIDDVFPGDIDDILFAPGLANYVGPGSGTFGDPYKWAILPACVWIPPGNASGRSACTHPTIRFLRGAAGSSW